MPATRLQFRQRLLLARDYFSAGFSTRELTEFFNYGRGSNNVIKLTITECWKHVKDLETDGIVRLEKDVWTWV